MRIEALGRISLVMLIGLSAAGAEERGWEKTISPQRQLLIRCLANDECEGVSPDPREDPDDFLETATSAELHLLADAWNWDGGVRTLQAVIRHPRCDAGTALLVYWRGRPEFYLQFATRAEVPGWALPTFDLLAEIEQRYLKDQYRSRAIPFDPKEAAGGYEDGQAKAKRSLPPVMLAPIAPAARTLNK